MSTLLFGLTLAIGAPAAKDAPKEQGKIEGDWLVESVEGPKEVPPETVTFQFTKDQISILEGPKGRPENAGYALDRTKKPPTIDITPGRKGQKTEVILGIIEVSGDQMTLCFARDGLPRPKEFKGDAANGIMLIKLKRIKPEK